MSRAERKTMSSGITGPPLSQQDRLSLSANMGIMSFVSPEITDNTLSKNETEVENDIKPTYPHPAELEIVSGDVPNRRPAKKLGTWSGVFAPCLLSIIGIIVFLRLGWVVGNAGIGLTTLIILLSALIAVITTLSMSAICTSREMLEGGPYYLISRSLGPRVGGSVGILYIISSALSAAFAAIGLAETFSDNVGWPREYWILVGIGLVACAVTFLIALVGVRWIAKFQLILLVALLLPFITFFIGSFLSPGSNPEDQALLTGYNSTTLRNNFGPGFLPNVNFLTVFGVYFPASTGFLAGASLSGNLTNAATSVPLGTLLAVLITTLMYLTVAWILGSVSFRDALQTHYFIMETVSVVRPIFYVGLYVTSFSGIISAFISGPRVLQSIALDGVLPPLKIFSKTTKFNGEPMRAHVVVFTLSLGAVFFGSLNVLAPLNTMFSLLMYCMLNYACFACSTGDARIGWNPSFRFYNRWISLLGALACFVFMFLVEWISALVSVALAVLLYFYIRYVNANVKFDYFRFDILSYLGIRSRKINGSQVVSVELRDMNPFSDDQLSPYFPKKVTPDNEQDIPMNVTDLNDAAEKSMNQVTQDPFMADEEKAIEFPSSRVSSSNSYVASGRHPFLLNPAQSEDLSEHKESL